MSTRGKNFTERDKCKVLELVQKYHKIIENKCTNAVSSLKKEEAWLHISKEFNSAAEVPRTIKQLSTAYLNLKRLTRRSIANDNVKRYIRQNENSPGEPEVLLLTDEPNKHSEEELENQLKQFKKDEIADKKGVRATGGSTYQPVLSNVGAQMLAVMGDQLTPLSNNCDSASSYYHNVPLQNVQETSTASSQIQTQGQEISKLRIKKKIQQKKTINNELVKRQFYVKKYECAIIEKKTKLLEHKKAMITYECALTEKKTKLLEHKMAIKKNKLLNLEIETKEKEYQS